MSDTPPPADPADRRGDDPPAGERWAEIERVLDVALDVPPDERPGVLDRECGDDEELRREVESLLRRRPEIEGFLEDAPAVAASEGTGDAEEGGAGPPRRRGVPASAAEGSRVGVYRILRRLARGGMGEVYLAERADGHFEKRVALKLLPPDLEAEDVVRRFRSERQILAGLEHPSIARLLDGGVTGDGRPYLVMEYVDGEPIDRHCDRRGLPIRERLDLFLQVVEAIHHAHRSLVIHRDLKPSNIHVTPDGRVKLLDFGIAKLLDEETGAAERVTRPGRRWMTPEYAAPEQIEGARVTTATDVHQLGVLLYQLMVGRLPFRAPGTTPHRLERAILETEPVRPSTAATWDDAPGEAEPREQASGSGTTDPPTPRELARARSTRPAALSRTLRGDLDAIALRALRKDPEDRYPSARAMAEDVERHLRGEPVAARRGTVLYRARTFLRRHRWGVAAAAAFLVLLAGYAVTVTVQSGRVRAALEEARVESRTSEQVAAFLVDLFEASDPGEAPGETVTARELLERGVERVDGLDGQPEVQARMLDEMGRAYQGLGLYDRAEPLLRRALALRRSVHGEDPMEVAKSLDNVATLLQRQGRYGEAEPLFRRALAIRRSHPDPEKANVDVGLNNLALLLKQKGDRAAARRLYREALAIKRERFGRESPETATALHNLASLLRESGELADAEPLLRRALSLRREALGEEHPRVAESRSQLGRLLADRGDLAGAEPLVRKALAARRSLLGEDHPDVTTSLHNLAALLREKGDLEEAEELAREVVDRDRRQLGPRHPYVASSLLNLARVRIARGDAAGAEPLLREALEIRREGLPAGHWEIAEAEGVLGECLAALGRGREAAPLLRESHARLLKSFGPEDRRTRMAARRLAELQAARSSDGSATGSVSASP